MKREVDDAYAAYLKGVESGKKAKTRFNIMTELIKQRYENASKEIKDQCEAYRTKEHGKGSVEDPSAKNREYQELVQRILKRITEYLLTYRYSAIDRLPLTIRALLETIAKKAGWVGTIIVGGPNPRLGGKITSCM